MEKIKIENVQRFLNLTNKFGLIAMEITEAKYNKGKF